MGHPRHMHGGDGLRKKETAQGRAGQAAPTMVYVGPSIKNILQGGTAFKGGYPPKVAEMLKAHPFMAGLMVPAGKLADARKSMADPGGELATLYRRAEKGV